MNTTKTLGQIAFEEFYANAKIGATWKACLDRHDWEAAAAVLAARWRHVTDPPKDPYAELKKAHAAGKAIQILMPDGSWKDCTKEGGPIGWIAQPDEYRVKPWTLSRHLRGFRPLEPGEAWHFADTWVECMLPEGWRPLLVGEADQQGDEAFVDDKWLRVFNDLVTKPDHMTCPRRTRRPLPPTNYELERKEFEEWAKGYGYDTRRNMAGMLIDSETHNAWIGWQAARNSKHARTS